MIRKWEQADKGQLDSPVTPLSLQNIQAAHKYQSSGSHTEEKVHAQTKKKITPGTRSLVKLEQEGRTEHALGCGNWLGKELRNRNNKTRTEKDGNTEYGIREAGAKREERQTLVEQGDGNGTTAAFAY